MAKAKSKYVLSAHEETERLERQARMKAYDFRQELGFLKVHEDQRILDAGCGSGIVADYLSRLAPRLQVVGCDFSKERVEAASAQYGSAPNLSFVQQNLLEPISSGDRYDTIVCRYVLRHFNPNDGKKVIRNLFEALKPGGTLYCIDLEGLMGEIYPASSFLSDSLKKIREAKSVDFQVARKLPALLTEQGFNNVDWHVLVSEFKGSELEQETLNLEQSVTNAESFVSQLLGGPKALERFKKEYFGALREQTGLVLCYNRVIASGTKPASKLKIVT